MEEWSNYWKSGASDCLLSGDKNIIDNYWNNYLGSIQSEEHVFFDIACGNGYLCNQIDNFENLTHKQIIAYDNANVLVEENVHLIQDFETLKDKIQNLKNTKAILLSNFGIEYLPLAQLEQLFSTYAVTKGEVTLLTHTADSVLHKNSQKIFDVIDIWKNDKELLSIENELRKQLTPELAKSYILRVSKLDIEHQGLMSLATINNNVIELFSKLGANSNLSDRFDLIKVEFDSYKQRILSQMKATSNVKDVAAIMESLADKEDLKFEREKLYDQNNILVAEVLKLRTSD